MAQFSLTQGLLLRSAFTGLFVVLEIFLMTQQAHAQTNIGSANNTRPIRFFSDVLLQPANLREVKQSYFFPGGSQGEIRLESRFLGAQKFVYNGQAPQKVYGFWGFSFKPEFQEVLSLHPEAFNEARKAYPYNTLKFVGALGLVAMSAKLLINTINESQEISQGRLADGSSNTTDFILIGAAGTLTIVSGILSKKHLTNGVKIFNQRQK